MLIASLLDSLELANHSKSRTNGDYTLDGSDTYLHIVSSLREGTSCLNRPTELL